MYRNEFEKANQEIRLLISIGIALVGGCLFLLITQVKMDEIEPFNLSIGLLACFLINMFLLKDYKFYDDSDDDFDID